MTIERPTNCQTSTTKIVQSAHVGSPVQARCNDSSPTAPRKLLSGPVKLKMNCQTYETASELITTGRKNIARSRPRDLSVRLQRRARAPRPITFAVTHEREGEHHRVLERAARRGIVEDLAEVVEPDPVRAAADPVPVGERVPRAGARCDVSEREHDRDRRDDPEPRHARGWRAAAAADRGDGLGDVGHGRCSGRGTRIGAGHAAGPDPDDALLPRLAYRPQAESRSARVWATVFCPVSRPWTSLPRVSTTAGFDQLRFISGKTFEFTLRNVPRPRSS